jgi:serine/threonine protein kinase
VLTGRLGSGGMGRVYLARSPGGRMVAVKVIRAALAEDAGFRARFAREVSAARKVGGMYTAQVVDADVNGPIPWLVTAYVPGTSLSDAVERQGPLPAQSVLALAAGLAEGLTAIHAAGVIHRDLKPSNVLLAPDGPRIIDFGISSAAEATALTGTGFMIGSPGFMSPEQAEGITVGPASDIFSLAGVLIYAGRGEGPFGTGDTAALLYRVVHGKPNIDNIPDKLRPLIRRSLSRDAKRRPSASQFLTDLSAAYPSAADLTNWLPPRLLDASAAADAGPATAGTFGPSFNAGPPAFTAPPDVIAAAADNSDPVTSGNTALGSPTQTSRAEPTPPPPTQVSPGSQGYQGGPGYQGGQGYPGDPGYQGSQGYSGSQGHSGAQGYSGAQQYPAPQGYSGPQQYPAPQGYSTGQGDPVAPGSSGIQESPGGPGNPWWSAQQQADASQPGMAQPGMAQPGMAQAGMQQPGFQQTPPPGQGGPGVPGSEQWYTPPVQPTPRRKRPRWLLPVGAAAVALVVIIALVFALGGNSPTTATAGQTSTSSPTQRASSPAANATPTVGNLQLTQFQAGDCLTGSNMDLNKNTPWPKITEAVPCSQSHTAEVFYANNHYWPKGGSYPGDSTIRNDANSECDNAFQAYVGIPYSKSKYTWTNVVPDASTWPNGDRALHCVAYYATPSQPAGVPLTGSIKGTDQ